MHGSKTSKSNSVYSSNDCTLYLTKHIKYYVRKKSAEFWVLNLNVPT